MFTTNMATGNVDLEEELSVLELSFQSAASRLQVLSQNMTSEDLLSFYGLYKQAIQGRCCTEKPAFWDMTGKQKWEAWKKLEDMTKEQAMKEYIKLLKKVDPDWQPKKPEDSKGTNLNFGVSVSRMQRTDSILDEDAKTPFDWVKENDLEKLKNKKFEINIKDDDGLSLLHWASDRGLVDVVEYLLKAGISINDQDSEGQTALHYACTCDHVSVVKVLLKNGADSKLLDNEGNTPSEVSSNKDVMQLLLQSK